MTDPIPTLLSRLKALHAKRRPPWSIEEIYDDSRQVNQLKKWKITRHEIYDTSGMTGSGIVSSSYEQFAYLQADDETAAHIEDVINSTPQLLAHIEAQDKRIDAASGLVEALEAQDHRTECSKEQGCIADCPLALLAAWRKNHG